jgi:hypothetical protein
MFPSLLFVLLPFFASLCAAQNTQILECFAVDFDGDNNGPRTNNNPDFTRCYAGVDGGLVTGMVEEDLGTNNQPVLTAKQNHLFHGPTWFSEWWNGSPTTRNFWTTIELTEDTTTNPSKW